MGNKMSSGSSTSTDSLDTSIDSEEVNIEVPNKQTEIINLIEQNILKFQNKVKEVKDTLDTPINIKVPNEQTEIINLIEQSPRKFEKKIKEIKDSSDTSIDSEEVDIEIPNKQTEMINLYIDQSLLKFQNKIKENNRLYEIKGETFVDAKQPIVDKYSEFELYVHKMEASNFFKMDDSPDKYCALPEDEDEIETSPHYEISIQKAPHGVVINSILYLTDHNWNTLVFIDPNNVNCMVCDQCMPLLQCPFHIVQKQHEKNLDMYKPLQQFELNIIRKVKDKYHCGICNESFHIDDDYDHLDSETHNENQLFAYNKACDVIIDSDLSSNNGNRINDCYHFDANRINDNNTTNNDWTITDWAKDNAYSDDYTDYTTNSGSVDIDYEYDLSEFDTNELPLPGVSYASMAKKPKVYNNPKFLIINNGTNEYKVLFDSWHMIILNKNTFWCMACKLQDHIKFKAKHCIEEEHVGTLRSLANVKKFTYHIIRAVDEKLYHCAHCNFLHLAHDMADHLNNKHPVKDGKYETTPTASFFIKENDAANINHNKPNTIKEDARNRNNDKQVNDTNIAVGGKNDDFLTVLAYFTTNVGVYAFGPTVNVLLMAYHVICVKENENCFYCGLCVITLPPKDMVRHILELRHIRLLQIHQFLPEFGSHLLRCIHGALHCAMCNVPIQPNFIVQHIESPLHIANFKKAFTALPQNINIPQPNTVTLREIKPIVTKDDHASNPITITKSGLKEPRIITKKTETKVKTEEMELTKQKTGLRHQETGLKQQETGLKQQETGLRQQETGLRQQGTGFWQQEAGLRQQETGFWQQEPGLRQQETGLVKQETELMMNEKIETDEMDNSYDSVNDMLFDLESYVFVEFKGGFKLTATSYHTLVAIGDGSRHCFICNVDLEKEQLKKHVDSREHEKNLDGYKFLDKYGRNLIRQSYILYHCCICNVILRYSELSNHFEWQPHTDTLKKMKSVMKKQRKIEVPTKMIAIKTQKEEIFLDVKEPEIKIVYSAVIIDNKSIEKKKLFLVNNILLKIKFESWHGIASMKNGFKCIVCQIDFSKDIMLHIAEERHEKNLEKEFLEKYSTALVRQINGDLVNCVICNVELSSKTDVVNEHIGGKKHRKNYDIILNYSTEAETYGDCCGDIINI